MQARKCRSTCNRRSAAREASAATERSATAIAAPCCSRRSTAGESTSSSHGALFYDTGAVGASLDELGRFERNYGIGLRAGSRMGSAFRIDFAFGGREGNRLLIRFDDVF